MTVCVATAILREMFARTIKPTTTLSVAKGRKRVPYIGTSRVGGVCVLDA